MKALACGAAIIIAMVAHHASARADSCGGGNSGGGSSSGGGGGGGDGDSEPSCVEVSEVVGYSTCRRFGSWDAGHRPPIRFSVGTSAHRLAPGSISLGDHASHPDMTGNTSYRLVTDDPSDGFVGGSVDLSATLALSANTYAGFELQFGSLTTGSLRAQTDNENLLVTPTSVTYGAASAVAGVKAPIGNWDLRGEVAAGVEMFAISSETRHEECVLSEASMMAAAAVKPRVIIERWISPWASVGAGIGSNLLRRGDLSGSLFLTGHLRAFDGGR